MWAELLSATIPSLVITTTWYTIFDGNYPSKYVILPKNKNWLETVERAFEVLQAYFAAHRDLVELWDAETLWEVMTTCVIIHNMIVEDEDDEVCHALDFQNMGYPI